jgi:hypothetical protein
MIYTVHLTPYTYGSMRGGVDAVGLPFNSLILKDSDSWGFILLTGNECFF